MIERAEGADLLALAGGELAACELPVGLEVVPAGRYLELPPPGYCPGR